MKKIYEQVGVMATVDPQLVDNAAATSDWVLMKYIDRVAFVVSVGATDTTVDVKLQQASDASGTGAADISGYSVTQLTADDDNKQVIIEIDAATVLAAVSTKPYVAVVVTAGNGTTGAQISAVGLGYWFDYSFPADNDLASVVQIVG